MLGCLLVLGLIWWEIWLFSQFACGVGSRLSLVWMASGSFESFPLLWGAFCSSGDFLRSKAFLEYVTIVEFGAASVLSPSPVCLRNTFVYLFLGIPECLLRFLLSVLSVEKNQEPFGHSSVSHRPSAADREFFPNFSVCFFCWRPLLSMWRPPSDCGESRSLGPSSTHSLSCSC